ncbi:hypothetical protein SU69_05865 [Thermosipho melanesiensis]|uniref:Uncharacterized protein n=2 Tax=Thermosipho melanesiensis TaxID=46541 RepID=A6LM57_THEM4|nr:hypothetical protein [Thermosipho melanesiensis]ABR31008.1 hypothetical protein Tmel_1153 [Thermosipho melanesiensis BI429]APT74102.1 hypothetical protein BW47_06160 [Thermosipho melanesiensis]OOC36049.1 hypothetical protein SU68_05935 [Thermosipho melanesiensis]OOC36866.1 hypothetical protein SU69_05865 [Thermosipho melanesiensis]OOC37617.1 hypothetical protein SU70_05875 [Thermosipho melanesiensis]
MDGWKEISYILKKVIGTYQLSLFDISKKLEIDFRRLQKYFEGSFYFDEMVVREDLRKIKRFFNISEDILTYYELGKSKRESNTKIKKGYSIYFLLFISFILFYFSLKLFVSTYKAPLAILRAQSGLIALNGKEGYEFKLDEGEYIVKGKALLFKINNEIKKIDMDRFKVVVEWGK